MYAAMAKKMDSLVDCKQIPHVLKEQRSIDAANSMVESLNVPGYYRRKRGSTPLHGFWLIIR